MKGKRIWIPAMVIKEMEDIKIEDNIEENCLALRELVKYARVGREINRWRKFDLSRKPLKHDLDIDNIKGYKLNKKTSVNYAAKEGIPDVI